MSFFLLARSCSREFLLAGHQHFTVTIEPWLLPDTYLGILSQLSISKMFRLEDERPFMAGDRPIFLTTVLKCSTYCVGRPHTAGIWGAHFGWHTTLHSEKSSRKHIYHNEDTASTQVKPPPDPKSLPLFPNLMCCNQTLEVVASLQRREIMHNIWKHFLPLCCITSMSAFWTEI